MAEDLSKKKLIRHETIKIIRKLSDDIKKLLTEQVNEGVILRLISYLKNCTEATKVGSSFSELLHIIYGCPQRSIPGPLLFILCIYDLFIVDKDVNVSSYADDTTPFITFMRIEQIIPKLESILSDIP